MQTLRPDSNTTELHPRLSFNSFPTFLRSVFMSPPESTTPKLPSPSSTPVPRPSQDPDRSICMSNGSEPHSNGHLESPNPKTSDSRTPWSIHATPDDPNPHKQTLVTDSFLFPEHMRPTVKHDDFTDLEIPVIDLSSSHEEVVAQVREACLHWGFFQILNHGVEESLLERIQHQADLFFNLPYGEKEKVSKPPGKFAGYGHATVKEGDAKPWSEGFYFTDVESTRELAEKVWPENGNADFVNSYREYNDQIRRVSELLMHLVVSSLDGVNPAHFTKYTHNTGGLFRWNYYPACPEPFKTLGLTEHTDFNLLTVVHQGQIGGLQILKEGRWIAIKPRPGALAVNLGDTLQVLTNSRYKSVPHRAVVNATQSRLSLVYFYVPLSSIEIVPAPELVDEDHPCKYKPFIFEQFTKMKQLHFLNTLDHFLIDQ